MKKTLILFVMAALVFSLSGHAGNYLIATDYVKADGKTDCTAAIQKLIDKNPHRTIYFPDGVYMLSSSILTPADPNKAVHLVFANFATFKASEKWQKGSGALVRLGGKNPYNSININGSNYGIEGGIFDGSGVADGISIDGGRETRINHVSIKHVQTGIHIKHGANSGSSDSDIHDINIVGNDDAHSVGVLVEGYDNTFTNMRIASVNIGIWCKTGGNSFKNIHPLYIYKDTQDYPSSCGFVVEQSNNWLDYCYSDQFATAFKLGKGVCANLTDCFALWYKSKDVPFQTAIACDGKLESYVYGLHVGGNLDDCPEFNLLRAEKGGQGTLKKPRYPGKRRSDKDAMEYYLNK